MAIAIWMKGLIPDRWQVPVRYHYRKARGVLERELPVARSLVREGSTAVDIGAHDGTYSYVLASRAARVEAFEPLPWCAGMLRAHAQGGGRLRVHQVAVSDASGELSLRIPIRGGKERPTEATLSDRALDVGHRELKIQVETLDSFAFQDVSLIKIDVEGHELAVLRGARETLARERPVLLIEVEQRHLGGREIDDVFSEIASYGYTGWTVGSDRKLRPIAEFDAGRDQRLEDSGEPGPRYVNNFFWLPVPV